jgi:alpha-1,2-mannosyltransferase
MAVVSDDAAHLSDDAAASRNLAPASPGWNGAIAAEDESRRWTPALLARAATLCALPLLVGLFVASATFPGGSMVPWKPVMVDLDVYRQAGRVLLEGGDIYSLPGSLPFLYPPFAALLAVPLALFPAPAVQILWTVVGVLAVLAMMHRFGLSGWVLSLAGSVAICLVEPVTQTLAFGQLGILLTALVVLDLVPGPRILPGSPRRSPPSFRRRRLPEGAMTAVAAALKLTPGIFLIYLLAVGKRRAALVTVAVGAAVTALSWVVAPAISADFWGRLAHGDTGLGHSIIYYTNQSVMADVIRVFGVSSSVSTLALLPALLVVLVGVWAAALWHRLGDVALAVTLCGIAGLLASPVSWSHHFIWVVPFALCLIGTPRRSATSGEQRTATRLPIWYQIVGWLFVGWVVAAPFKQLPNGGDVELTWTGSQHWLASMTAVLGMAVLVGSVALAWTRRRIQRGQPQR